MRRRSRKQLNWIKSLGYVFIFLRFSVPSFSFKTRIFHACQKTVTRKSHASLTVSVFSFPRRTAKPIASRGHAKSSTRSWRSSASAKSSFTVRCSLRDTSKVCRSFGKPAHLLSQHDTRTISYARTHTQTHARAESSRFFKEARSTPGEHTRKNGTDAFLLCERLSSTRCMKYLFLMFRIHSSCCVCVCYRRNPNTQIKYFKCSKFAFLNIFSQLFLLAI